MRLPPFVPAKEGIQIFHPLFARTNNWVPAFAGTNGTMVSK